jgi:hypothetical protein
VVSAVVHRGDGATVYSGALRGTDHREHAWSCALTDSTNTTTSVVSACRCRHGVFCGCYRTDRGRVQLGGQDRAGASVGGGCFFDPPELVAQPGVYSIRCKQHVSTLAAANDDRRSDPAVWCVEQLQATYQYR